MHFLLLIVYSVTDGIIDEIKKKIGGVFGIFSVNKKFQFDFIDKITNKISMNNNI
jgi:hypothetical protein